MPFLSTGRIFCIPVASKCCVNVWGEKRQLERICFCPCVCLRTCVCQSCSPLLPWQHWALGSGSFAARRCQSRAAGSLAASLLWRNARTQTHFSMWITDKLMDTLCPTHCPPWGTQCCRILMFSLPKWRWTKLFFVVSNEASVIQMMTSWCSRYKQFPLHPSASSLRPEPSSLLRFLFLVCLLAAAVSNLYYVCFCKTLMYSSYSTGLNIFTMSDFSYWIRKLDGRPRNTL